MRREIEDDLRRTIRVTGEIQREAKQLLDLVATVDDPDVCQRVERLQIRLAEQDSTVGIWASVVRVILPWWRRIWVRPRKVTRWTAEQDD